MIYVLLISLLVCFELYSKHLINKNIKQNQKIELIKDKFYLTNIKNGGGAYGVMHDKKVILQTLSSILIFKYILELFYFDKSATNKKKICYVLIISGGVANMYERLIKKEVTDFLYIKFKKMPIFNIADMFIFLGSIFLIFFHKKVDKFN